MVLNRRKPAPDLTEKLLEPVNAESGMEPPLHEKLGPPDVDKLGDLAVNRFRIEKIGVSILLVPVESAEFTSGNTDIGVVDIPVNHEGHPVVGMESPPDIVSQTTDRQQIPLRQEP